MSTPAAFKKAIQQLTTVIVKAEREEAGSAEREKFRAEIQSQLDALVALHAEMPTEGERTHQGWYEQTVARARAILGVSS